MEEEVEKFWAEEANKINAISSATDFRNVDLPVARVKKIMKLDEDVKLVSAESPVLLAKAAEIFIRELSIRAWYNVEESKRRLVRAKDISAALAKSDQFDFLIDILPKEAVQAKNNQAEQQATTSSNELPQQTSTLQTFSLNQPIQLINGQYYIG